jgi:hypothetical protein
VRAGGGGTVLWEFQEGLFRLKDLGEEQDLTAFKERARGKRRSAFFAPGIS